MAIGKNKYFKCDLFEGQTTIENTYSKKYTIWK